ncbi:MAG TPA: PAS domain S-box protein [Candidatus Didemnitutus sp.]|nr:PAS domain S-box protein [Candidatus Didemnitutus sp.]
MNQPRIKYAVAVDTALRISAAYALFGVAWILASDTIASWLSQNAAGFERVSQFKGLAFIGITSGLLYIFTKRFVTQQKHSEQKLADMLAFEKAVIHSSPLGVIACSADGQVLMANAAAARFAGTDIHGVCRLNFRELKSWQDTGLLALADEALMSGEEKTYRGPHTTAFGRAVWAEAHFIPFDYAGRRHLLLMISDETANRRATEGLHLLNAAVQAAPDGWVITDAEGAIEFVNPAFTELTGYIAPEVIGRNPSFLQSGRQDSGFYAAMWDTINRGEVWRGELENRRKDGTIYQEKMTIAPVRSAQGRIEHFVAIKHDISGQKRLELQMARAQRLESIGLIASGIAHDLNNMLSPIMLSIGILRMRHADAETVESLRLMENAAHRGAAVVRQVLTFARGVEGERVPLVPKHLIKEVAELARETFPREISVSVDLASDLNHVNGDVTQLHQVLLNLAVNARDAMPEGGRLTLHAENTVVDLVRAAQQVVPVRAGDYVVLGIRDTGTGITPEVLERIFEPFFTTKPRDKGTGLGLSTVFGIVRSHGGFIEVETELGRGTDFRVLLPAVKQSVDPSTPTEAKPVALVGANRTLLVVEDEKTIREVTSLILARQGFQVVTAVDGADGLLKFCAEPTRFSAVLLDLMLPRLNGYKLAREIRGRAPNLPIIVSTGTAGDSQETDSVAVLRSLGVKSILRKPYVDSALVEALRRELDAQVEPAAATRK